MAEATGAGLIWFMGRDHLSPPLSNLDQYALDSSRWREASSMRVVDLAQRMGVLTGDNVLELGCGIGGPGRDVLDISGATVHGLSISINQLRNLRNISAGVGYSYKSVIKGDMQHIPFADNTLSHVYSINAMYHVNNPTAVAEESYRVLQNGGRLGADDWFVTDQTSPDQLSKLRHNWSTSANGFHNFNKFIASMKGCGFKVIDIKDYTEEAAVFLTEDRFGMTYDEQIAPTLLGAFPRLYQYSGYEPSHAAMAVAQLRSGILYMGQLYSSGDAIYRQVIGEK